MANLPLREGIGGGLAGTLLVAVLVASATAHAQLPAAQLPADCPAAPGPVSSVPLWLDLKGLPGVPREVSGQVFADLPAAPPGGTLCETALPALPQDVLRGEPGNLLRGPAGRGDVLRGKRPRVEVQPAPVANRP